MALALYYGFKSTLATIVLANCYSLNYMAVTQNPFLLAPNSS